MHPDAQEAAAGGSSGSSFLSSFLIKLGKHASLTSLVLHFVGKTEYVLKSSKSQSQMLLAIMLCYNGEGVVELNYIHT